MIGQMLDYAANAATFWSADSHSPDFEATCEQTGWQPEQVLSEFLSDVRPPRHSGNVSPRTLMLVGYEWFSWRIASHLKCSAWLSS